MTHAIGVGWSFFSNSPLLFRGGNHLRHTSLEGRGNTVTHSPLGLTTPQHVLVTGGAGFVGSHIVDNLRAHGHRVTVIDCFDREVHPVDPNYLREDVEYVRMDLRDLEFAASLRTVTVVVHLAARGGVARAARDPEIVWQGNVGGTLRLRHALEQYCPLLQLVVIAGSFSAYGDGYQYRCQDNTIISGARCSARLAAGIYDVWDVTANAPATIIPITEAAATDPKELYGQSKLGQERCFDGFTHARVVILRFSSVYGLRLRLNDGEATIIAKLLGLLQRGEVPEIFEDGRQSRDWVLVGDIVELVLRLVHGLEAPRLVNVCSGEPIALLEAYEILRASFGSNVQANIVGGYRSGDMRHCVGNPALFTALLGRSPTPFRTGIEQLFGTPVNS